MAIPKICGIENEFGFSVFKKGTDHQFFDAGYRYAAHELVGKFLAALEAIKYDPSRESRRQSILKNLNIKKTDQSIEDILHSQLISNCSDWGGFLSNGARFYLDVDHPEYCTPECRLPLDLVAHDKASELVLQSAIKLFQAGELNKDYDIFLHKNNSDGYGHSYGSHLNVLMNRSLLASAESFGYLVRHYVPFQIARIILIGGGKRGFENNSRPCDFQISQRADFFECLLSENTVSRRPIFNLRDEPHADPSKYFRLHDISTDALLCETAMFLRVALSQVVLAMIEDRFLTENVMPKYPILAIKRVSRDLEFNDQIPLENGKKMTGLEILSYYLDKSEEYLKINSMHEQHVVAVKLAKDILEKIFDDPFSAFGILDWSTALGISESQPDKAIENLFKFREISDDSLFKKFQDRGKIIRKCSDEEILRACGQAPLDTRAYVRGEIIKRYSQDIRMMNWSYVIFGNNNLDLPVPELDNIQGNMILSKLGI